VINGILARHLFAILVAAHYLQRLRPDVMPVEMYGEKTKESVTKASSRAGQAGAILAVSWYATRALSRQRDQPPWQYLVRRRRVFAAELAVTWP
jgi:hypothetical protein